MFYDLYDASTPHFIHITQSSPFFVHTHSGRLLMPLPWSSYRLPSHVSLYITAIIITLWSRIIICSPLRTSFHTISLTFSNSAFVHIDLIPLLHFTRLSYHFLGTSVTFSAPANHFLSICIFIRMAFDSRFIGCLLFTHQSDGDGNRRNIIDQTLSDTWSVLRHLLSAVGVAFSIQMNCLFIKFCAK